MSFPNNQRLLNLLHATKNSCSLKAAKALHGLIITLHHSLPQPVYLHNNLINLYSTLGEYSLARKLFDQMPYRNIVSFNTMIGAYLKSEDVERAWNLFSKIRASGFRPTQHTLAGLLACKSIHFGCAIQLHALGIKDGLFSSTAFVGTALLCLYGRLGLVDRATWIFEDMTNKTLATWNALITLLGDYGFVEASVSLFCLLMRRSSFSECTVSGILSCLSNERYLEIGEQIHGLMVKSGLDFDVSIINCLINMYGKCDSPCSAAKMFETASSADKVSWNTIIDVMGKGDDPINALQYFVEMLVEGLLPSQATFVSVMTSCARIQILELGQQVHGMVMKNGIDSDVFIGSSLIEFYLKCNGLEDARHCFDGIHEKNVVSWNTLLSGYANTCHLRSASLFLQMLRSGFKPNATTFASASKCSSVLKPHHLHSLVAKSGCEDNDYVVSSLMTSYAKNGYLNDALLLMDDLSSASSVVALNTMAGIYNRAGKYHESLKQLLTMEDVDAASWNIVLAACARSGNYIEVFQLFKQMRGTGLVPADGYTFVSLLSASKKLCNLALGCCVHGLILKHDSRHCDKFVRNVLIDMYAKCGSLGSSVKVFEESDERNVITWTALLSGLGSHGKGGEAVDGFRKMTDEGVIPDGVAFIAVLSACARGGLLKEGMDLFQKMWATYGVQPGMEHYHCVVDLLCRNGYIRDAEKLLATMPFPPDALVWRSFLEGCKRYSPRCSRNQT